jgi:RimJ/RimL family protein N-acetyltransferase
VGRHGEWGGMEIETERLRLREPEPGDWEALHRYQSLPEVRRHTLPGQGTAAHAQTFVRAAIQAAWRDPRRFYSLVVCLKADGRIVGTCVLALPHGGTDSTHIGWDTDPAHWGRGFATEAAGALLGYAFREIGLREVTARCYADNAASRRVMEKLGMRRRRPGAAEHWRARLGRGRPCGVRGLRWAAYGRLLFSVARHCAARPFTSAPLSGTNIRKVYGRQATPRRPIEHNIRSSTDGPGRFSRPSAFDSAPSLESSESSRHR